MASALNDVTREFGTALGVALLGAVLSAGYRTSIDSRLDGVSTDLADTAREGVANAVAAADGAGPQARALVRAAQESFVDGWQNAMWAGAAVMAVLFVHVLARGPQRAALAGDRTEGDSEEERGATSTAASRWTPSPSTCSARNGRAVTSGPRCST